MLADCKIELLRRVNGLILDVDEVLFEGQQALPGAVELAAHLYKNETPHVFLSNNTTYPFQYHLNRLSRLGIRVSPNEIITAARVTAQTLVAEAEPGVCCLVIGERGLVEALSAAGFEITQSAYQRADYVVIGMDRLLTYDKLKCAALAILNGAQFICSNPDPVYPDGKELIPASGAIQAALEISTGIMARVIGKPALPCFELALERLGTCPAQTAMLGDQPDIDIVGAVDAGLHPFLVLSSLTPEYRPHKAKYSPEAIFTSALDFYEHWSMR